MAETFSTELAFARLTASEDVFQATKYGLLYVTLWILLVSVIRSYGGTSKFVQNARLNAYYLVGIIPILWTSWLGLSNLSVLWGYSTPEGRMFGEILSARRICVQQLGYQIFCIVVGTLAGPPLNKPEMYAHHTFAGIAALLSLFPYAQYYTFFFGSLVEISNIPLTVMDIFRANREYIDSYPTVYLAAKLLFAVTFIPLRNALWVPFALQFTGDIYNLRNRISFAGQAITYLALWFLSALQFIWGGLVVKSVIAAFRKLRKET